jgi:hypothetical protein
MIVGESDFALDKKRANAEGFRPVIHCGVNVINNKRDLPYLSK